MWYNIAIYFFEKIITLGAFMNFKKAKKRCVIIENQNIKQNIIKPIWCHCASAGEFEQIIPFLIYLKNETKLPLTVSFFSASGYEFHQKNEIIDQIILLPTDTKSNANDIISKINPSFCIWIRKEFWHNIITILAQKKIRLFLVNYQGETKNSLFYKLYEENQLKLFDKIFQINKIVFPRPNIISSKNTKWDSVMDLIQHELHFNNIKDWTNNHFTIILGSCWQQEINFISQIRSKNPVLFHQIKWIFAPHNLNNEFIQNQFKTFDPLIFNPNQPILKENNCLLINQNGILKYVYKYGHLSIIGGGFKGGIHNILEPAAYGFPVLFGPLHSKFDEANSLIVNNLGFEIRNYESLEDKILFFYKKHLKNELKPIDFKQIFAEKLNGSYEIANYIIRSLK